MNWIGILLLVVVGSLCVAWCNTEDDRAEAEYDASYPQHRTPD